MPTHARSQQDWGQTSVGSLLSVPELSSSPRAPFPDRGHSSARVRKQLPHPLHPTSAQCRAAGPARGHLERPGRSRHASGPPAPPPHPRIPQIPAGGAWARLGARRAGACRGNAAEGGARWGDALPAPLGSPQQGLLPRKTQDLKLRNWDSRDHQGG